MQAEDETMQYDWVIFDYGGTLTVRRDPASAPVKPRNVYGQVLGDWFHLMGYEIHAGADEVQALTEQAHEALEGRPNALDWRYNESYYVRWIRSIYQQSGVPGPHPDHEMAAAWHFMCWQVGQRYGVRACESVIDTLDELRRRGLYLWQHTDIFRREGLKEALQG